MKNLLFIILIAAILSSCATKERCARLYPPSSSIQLIIKNDTIELIRDSTVYVPADSASIKALIECDSLGNAYIKEITELKSGKNVKPAIQLKNNVLKMDCKIDSLAVYFAWKETHIRNTRDSVSVQTIVERVNELTKWQRTQIQAGRLLFIILIILIGVGVYKVKRRLHL